MDETTDEVGQRSSTPVRRGLWTALIEHRFAYLALWDCAQLGGRHLAGHLGPLRVRARATIDGAAGRPSRWWSPSSCSPGFWQGLYLGRWHLGSFEEIAALLEGRGPRRGRVLFVVDLPLRWVPISVPVAALFIALVAMAALRYGWRLVIERRKRPSDEGTARVLVFGAGEGAEQVITAMLRDPDSPYLPVAIARRRPPQAAPPHPRRARAGHPRRHRRDRGRDRHAEVLLIAIPSADGALSASWPTSATQAGLKVMALPPVERPLRRPASAWPTSGRSPTPTCSAATRSTPTSTAIAGYLTGRRVLVTGRRRLDRLRAVPPGPPLRPRPAGDARPRRVAPSTPCSSRSTAGPCSTPATSWWPTSATATA